MHDHDPWRRVPVPGQWRLLASLPGTPLAGLHAVARARLAALRGRMLAPDAGLADLAAAIERRDPAGHDWAAREALLATGQAELRQIQAGFAESDATGRLATEVWEGAPRPIWLEGAALAQWQAAAAARLQRLAPAVLALEEAHPALRAEVAAARAARIAALVRRLEEHAGITWHRPPGAEDSTLASPIRAASVEAHAGPGRRVILHWRHDAANGMEWLRWQSVDGRGQEDGSVAGRDAVRAALRPLALAA